ncbi:hypothetical protein BJY04DRAFT_138233 [Aspergillus karnatakaensis]|uniref:uncharacterized protein n=1 Tax=Aspergillus karnatakaensis TaxID=1810916 RepID=UPI003CCD84B4
MQTASLPTDPLAILPPELVLRILEFASLSTVASLTAVSQAWRQFIDLTHQDAIYSIFSKAAQPSGATFSQWFDNITSSKKLCERQTLLERNWADAQPTTRELVLQVGDDPVWRFRADLKRRFIVSTSHAGGLNVTDIDTGQVIWRLPSTLDTAHEHAVRPYAHLEYDNGMVVFDREGDAVEVWQTDIEGAPRGEFRRIAVLDHDCQTRGFQLSYGTLCVVSTQGQGFVYDMTQRPPKLTTHLTIERDAVGHLDQCADAVIYSMGPRGYHVYDKRSGELLGALQPSQCTEHYHIRHPEAGPGSARVRPMYPQQSDLPHQFLSAGSPTRNNMVSIHLARGSLPPPDDPDHVRHGEDEWGAGMEDDGLFVGVSRAGRVFVCSDWRKALRDQKSLADCSAVIECESDGSTFDLGGWLSIRNHRLMFEIQDRAYVVTLDKNKRIPGVDSSNAASYSFLTCSMPQLAVPVSFMAIYDDVIMSTYTTLGRRQPPPIHPGGMAQDHRANAAHFFPTKTIRILTMAPNSAPVHNGEAPSAGEPLDEPNSHPSSADQARSQALLQLLSMLREEYGEPELSESDDGWEDID